MSQLLTDDRCLGFKLSASIAAARRAVRINMSVSFYTLLHFILLAAQRPQVGVMVQDCHLS